MSISVILLISLNNLNKLDLGVISSLHVRIAMTFLSSELGTDSFIFLSKPMNIYFIHTSNMKLSVYFASGFLSHIHCTKNKVNPVFRNIGYPEKNGSPAQYKYVSSGLLIQFLGQMICSCRKK